MLTAVAAAAVPLSGNAVATTLPFKFTLAAHNNTLPNANSTGAPLVLGWGGASTGVSYEITSTYASYPYNEYPSLSILNGSMRAYRSSGEWITNATEVISGGALGWVTSRMPLNSAPPAASFSVHEVRRTLAVYGIAHLWSLCPSYAFRGQNKVVYNVSQDARPEIVGYHPEDCYAVTLHVVEDAEPAKL
ncbi:hypothetical protein BDZ89DRAFT_943366 [Hymenopellis radicata]|nr:hypothetical protein BDZ89DRAFT_943366 [Hymenopellis radicata]